MKFSRDRGPSRLVTILVALFVVVAAFLIFELVGTYRADRRATVSSPDSSFAHISGQLSAQSNVPNAPYKIDQCINLTGSGMAALASAARTCAGVDAGAYRIVAVEKQPAQCPSDVDQKYFHGDVAVSYSLCLDINWQRDSCIATTATTAETVACEPKRAGLQAPSRVLTAVTSLAGCTSGGYVHPVRRFTICTEVR